jgi:CheY-like chemotaxis protein
LLTGWAEVPSHQTDQIPSQDDGSLRGLRVLAVDDDPDARELLTITLIRFGAEVRAADSAQQALEIFGQWRPDVLISDIEMPDIDGHTLIGKLRNLEPDEDGTLPAIALTAHARAEDRDRALRAGFHIHISKPVAPTELNLILFGLKDQIQKNRASTKLTTTATNKV